jgi:polar amino acid transport system substrate-binding protein
VAEGSDIASVDDLGDAIVGTQDGTTQEKFANNETDAAEVRGFPQGPDAISALITGQVDAVIIEQPVAADAVETQGGVEIVEELETGELFGWAVAPDNDGLREAMDEALETLKEDGTMDELYEQYFATAPPPSVAAGSTNEQLTND